MKFATAVPTKGSSEKFAVDKALQFVEEVRDAQAKIIVKNCKELSIPHLIKDLVESREEGRTLLEESPVGSGGSNGVVERSVWGQEGQLRAALLAFQKGLG